MDSVFSVVLQQLGLCRLLKTQPTADANHVSHFVKENWNKEMNNKSIISKSLMSKQAEQHSKEQHKQHPKASKELK